MGLNLILNGQARELPDLAPGASLAEIVAHLGLSSDRIALEQNGTIAPREQWARLRVNAGDRLEMVHFVGGGAS